MYDFTLLVTRTLSQNVTISRIPSNLQKGYNLCTTPFDIYINIMLYALEEEMVQCLEDYLHKIRLLNYRSDFLADIII